MSNGSNGNVIHADPSKEFFIDMLTRDISLSECVLDLLDNSVHGLIRHNNLDVMKPLLAGKLPPKTVDNFARIDFSGTQFSIEDNCGGISIDDARDEVFLHGNPNREKGKLGLGVYGIGLKRAVFKIGKKISIESNTKDEEFKVVIDVEAWKKKKSNWDLEFEYARKKKAKSGGTSILVKTLHDVPKKHFTSVQFKKLLKDRIATTYALFLKAGLKISVAGDPIAPEIPSFATSKELSPVHFVTKKDGVDIVVIAGATPVEDRKPRGWYVFCNGRCVLAGDQTERTGWGLDGMPQFHTKYNHFLGFLYMRSTDVHKLPWTTTKEGVERESSVYQTALAHMRSHSRPVLSFFDRMYKNDPEANFPERDLLSSAKSTSLEKVTGKGKSAFKANVKKGATDGVAIRYKKTVREIEKAKKAIGDANMSPAKVGEYTFDWYLKRNA